MKNVDSLKIASKFLKSEREKRGITIEEVSFELKLEKNLIIDIENRNFKKFNSYLFLRGYLVNYAEFLKVDINLPDIKEKKTASFKKEKYKPNKSKNKKYLKIIISLFILLLFIILASKLQKKDSSDIILNKSEHAKVDSKESDSIADKELTNNISNDDSVEYTNKGQNDIVSTDLNNSIDIHEDNSLNESKDDDIDDILHHNNTLVINYSGNSWTEIIDSNGDIIFFDLVKKNTVLKLEVEAPFEILLGNATVTNIKYNNKNVIIPYINPNNNVSKIIVDN
tara:strand:+ start:2631 stop:3476 length:846 start_codon:yes stop_codon:yes gene_type:complete